MKNQYNKKLSIGLPSGRMLESAYELFANQGIRSSQLEKNFDESMYKYEGQNVIFRIKKPSDIPQAIDGGYNDMGVCGFDSLREYELSNITPTGAMAGRGLVSGFINDLKLVDMALWVAGESVAINEYKEKMKNQMPLVVATAYPELARKFFAERYPNKLVDIRTLNGKVEGAIDEYGDDYIFDIVETGGTLKKNNLIKLEKAFDNPTKLLLSRVALRKDKRVFKIANQIKNALQTNEDKR